MILTGDELKSWLDQKRPLVLIDTGLAEDYTEAHLLGAQNACVFEVNFLEQVAALHGIARPDGEGPIRDAVIVVYGASARSLASETAARKLVAAGFTNVFDYRGGLEEWKSAGWSVGGNAPPRGEVPVEDRTYAISVEESVVEWTGRSLGGKHQGTVTLLPGGTITTADGRATAGSFGVDMTSINDTDLTDSALRQMLHHHLASDDFFDVDKYPRASFFLEGAEAIVNAAPSEPNHVIHGRFTLKGVEKPLSFKAQVGRSPAGDGGLVARANFDLDRTGWNVLYGSGKFYEKLGRHLVSDLITLDLKIVAR